ncbi:MAG: caspase family protein [Armatimonadetes bacterium]|nr:caspase family protein [Armatimonadota bacterium]
MLRPSRWPGWSRRPAASSGANLLLIIDACRNDPSAGRSSQNAQLDESFAKGLRPQLVARPATRRQPNVALLLACEAGQRAWEYPEERQGAFTYWLLKGLRTEASRTAEGVAVADLAALGSAQRPRVGGQVDTC